MTELIFATHNEHKAIEIQAILGVNNKVRTLKQAGFSEDIPEEQDTLEGNAVQKAWFVYKRLARNCFADDSGLEVVALGGAPGVYSARYAEMSDERMPGEPVSDANIRKLLAQMKGVGDRRAQFRTVIALVIKGREYTFKGIVEGSILKGIRGEGGFGYDPIFLPDGCRETFAEMTLDKKNKISHRARAVSKLANFLKNYSSE